jgi:hypothetical protein
MNRRTVLKALAVGVMQWSASRGALAQQLMKTSHVVPETHDDFIKDYLHKMSNFNKPHIDDIYVPRALHTIFISTVRRLRRLQRFVGHGNFQTLSFDDGLRLARLYSEIGAFPKAETRFMEMIFYSQAERYGFRAEKPLKELTARIKKNDIVKAQHSTISLYRGESFEILKSLKKQIGDQLILTSGVRGIMKQFLLFFNKAYRNNGNFSLASRSLAPPGYSFHGIGDFDVGQVNMGVENFSKTFTNTDVFKRLNDLGYIRFRYLDKNLLGVRYEPWHIKVHG